MNKIAVYAGTFDPITNGHLDVIQRAGKLFDKLIVAVGENPKKKHFFSFGERMEMLKECIKGMKNVELDSFSGLLVDFAKAKGASVLVRGLRELSDFEFEFQQAVVNRQLAPEIETVLIITDAKFFYLNSTMVKELASFNGNISELVPKIVEKKLLQKFKK